MYTTSHAVAAGPMNGTDSSAGVDGSGTINPAALSANTDPATLSVPQPTSSPRGVKRSRSPEHQTGSVTTGDHDDDDHGRRKRGRPPKHPRPPGNGALAPAHNNSQTPQMSSQSLPQQQGSAASPPSQTSPPPRSTPTKSTVKALPTVRDHTTDQLNEGGDEYLPKEWDEAGEKKVDALGYLKDNRQYKCRTFRVAHRGDKLFMLATECARVLGYRDSYLLFNKNRSLHKIIASQDEKDDLIQQDILPYSYRSRQIAIVTARSMFRQFGSRVIVNGRRVRDDYWESKARKQGFTEDDLAGEKRPGGSKARDAAAIEAANAGMYQSLGHGDVVYSNLDGVSHLPPGLGRSTAAMTPLPVVSLSPNTDDPRLREYSSMPRPRQEMTGQPYQDRTQPSNAAEILNQASHTVDFNKVLNAQRRLRQNNLQEFYAMPRENPIPEAPADASATQTLQSPQVNVSASSNNNTNNIMPPANAGQVPQQRGMMSQPTQMLAPGYPHAHPSPQQNAALAQSSPMQTVGRPGMRTSAAPPTPYGYPTQQPPPPTPQMWGQPPPQPQPQPQHPGTPMGMPQHQFPQQQQQPPQQSPRTRPRPPVTQQQVAMSAAMQMGAQMPTATLPQGMPAMNSYNARAMYVAQQQQQQQQQQHQQQQQAQPPQQQQQPGMNINMMSTWPSPSPAAVAAATAAGSMPVQQPQQPQQPGAWTGY